MHKRKTLTKTTVHFFHRLQDDALYKPYDMPQPKLNLGARAPLLRESGLQPTACSISVRTPQGQLKANDFLFWHNGGSLCGGVAVEFFKAWSADGEDFYVVVQECALLDSTAMPCCWVFGLERITRSRVLLVSRVLCQAPYLKENLVIIDQY